MSDFWYTYFIHRFLKAGLLAGREGLLLIDIEHSREEFVTDVIRETVALSFSAAGSVAEDVHPFRSLIEELTEYMDGERKTFSAHVHPGGSPFTRAVLESAARIPYGEVRTYREVASMAGNPGAVRAAGSALGKNPFPILIPCHRVVKSGGRLGGFGGGSDLKRKLLALEGIETRGDRIASPL